MPNFVLKIVLGTLASALEKASNLPLFRFVCLSYNVTSALCYSFTFLKNSCLFRWNNYSGFRWE